MLERYEKAMRTAIDTAASTHPHPNPRVGAVILDAGGEIVARGSHAGPGHPHAEVIALDAAGSAAGGGVLVSTLEPCDHHGRTPPCTDAILDAGIAKVVIGAEDPDVKVSGRGIQRLQAAGLEVHSGILAEQTEDLDPGYFHHRRTGLPLVTLKLALTLDGQIAATDGSSRWITGPEAREDAHQLRASHDAVMVGAGTVRADRPSLDVRLPEPHHQPRPVVVAGAGGLANAPLFDRDAVVLSPAPLNEVPDAIVVPGEDGIDLDKGLRALADLGLLAILVEGGSQLAGALVAGGFGDRLVFYFGAKLAGGSGIPALSGAFRTFDDAVDVEITAVTRLGPDLRVDFRRQ